MKRDKDKELKCNLCGADNFRLVLENYDRQHNKPGIFNIVKCNQCGLVYLNPRPKNINDYYTDDYVPYSIPKETFPESLTSKILSSERYYKKHKNSFDNICSWIFEKIYSPVPCKEKGKILDIGCGSGSYIYTLKKYGWDVYGLDISSKSVNFARSQLKLPNVFAGTIESKRFPDEFFNVILLKHVIEHLPDPRSSLKEIYRILKKDGLLLIITPNVSSLNFRLFKKFWFPLETPRHLYLFSPITLKKLINMTGFVQENISHGISTYTLAKSIGYVFKSDDNINDILMKIKIGLLPITLVLAIMGKGDIFTILCRKKR